MIVGATVGITAWSRLQRRMSKAAFRQGSAVKTQDFLSFEWGVDCSLLTVDWGNSLLKKPECKFLTCVSVFMFSTRLKSNKVIWKDCGIASTQQQKAVHFIIHFRNIYQNWKLIKLAIIAIYQGLNGHGSL